MMQEEQRKVAELEAFLDVQDEDSTSPGWPGLILFWGRPVLVANPLHA